MSLISIFESYLSFSFVLRLLQTYMPMRAKREVRRPSGYLMERAVWGAPPSTQNRFLFLFLLPVMILGRRHKCMTPKLVGIQWFLATQMCVVC